MLRGHIAYQQGGQVARPFRNKCKDRAAQRPCVTPQVLLRVFTQDYTSKPIITCDLSWEKYTKLGAQDPK
jgi:hypothetical protein